eukprot:TRINITY_DN4741_c0_g1_i1.p1 TRINITY_DN4741_c0_g1~~TRINITY_DN4741_c0_g1_i1.p1  ORF type:complete len:956 (-),score=196.51 TRINITY_DN4741_c0_g1_i1:292-3159(-)
MASKEKVARACNGRARWELAGLSEQRVFAAGITKLHDELVAKREADLLCMPRRANGLPILLQSQESFFRRLLQDRLEVKSCPESDISAAHMDIKHLSAEQLLTIRLHTLDFVTFSSSHTTHSNFLDAVDVHLQEKLARKLLRAKELQLPYRPSPLQGLGRRLVLVVGTAEHFAEGWGQLLATGKKDSATAPAVPKLWAVELERSCWPSLPVCAIFDSASLSCELFHADGEEKRQLLASDGGASSGVALVSDVSSGLGRSRAFRWEISALDPRSEDLAAALAVLERGDIGQVLSVPRPLSNGTLRMMRNGEAAAASPRQGGAAASPRQGGVGEAAASLADDEEAAMKTPRVPEKVEKTASSPSPPPSASASSPCAALSKAASPILARSPAPPGERPEACSPVACSTVACSPVACSPVACSPVTAVLDATSPTPASPGVGSPSPVTEAPTKAAPPAAVSPRPTEDTAVESFRGAPGTALGILEPPPKRLPMSTAALLACRATGFQDMQQANPPPAPTTGPQQQQQARDLSPKPTRVQAKISPSKPEQRVWKGEAPSPTKPQLPQATAPEVHEPKAQEAKKVIETEATKLPEQQQQPQQPEQPHKQPPQQVAPTNAEAANGIAEVATATAKTAAAVTSQPDTASDAEEQSEPEPQPAEDIPQASPEAPVPCIPAVALVPERPQRRQQQPEQTASDCLAVQRLTSHGLDGSCRSVPPVLRMASTGSILGAPDYEDTVQCAGVASARELPVSLVDGTSTPTGAPLRRALRPLRVPSRSLVAPPGPAGGIKAIRTLAPVLSSASNLSRSCSRLRSKESPSGQHLATTDASPGPPVGSAPTLPQRPLVDASPLRARVAVETPAPLRQACAVEAVPVRELVPVRRPLGPASTPSRAAAPHVAVGGAAGQPLLSMAAASVTAPQLPARRTLAEASQVTRLTSAGSAYPAASAVPVATVMQPRFR